MNPYSISIPGYRLGVQRKKRARDDDFSSRFSTESRSMTPYSYTDTIEDSMTRGSSTFSSRLPSESINPHSHGPDTLHQLRTAGLSAYDELPSQKYPGFPHRPVPTGRPRAARKRRRSEDEESAPEGVTEFKTKTTGDFSVKGQVARIRHLNTVTAIMHRCLRDGDIPRAKRAFGLLVRSRDVDIRLNHLWTVGSEILMQEGNYEEEKARARRRERVQAGEVSENTSDEEMLEREDVITDTDTPDSDSDESRSSDPDTSSSDSADSFAASRRNGRAERRRRRKKRMIPYRWGSKTSVEIVKTYFETLISHHPHDVHRPHLTSAVDFWPALFGIEVYNLNAEYKTALHRLHNQHDIPTMRSPSPSPEPDMMEIDSDNDSDYHARRKALVKRQIEKKKKRRHSESETESEAAYHDAIDVLRSTTQGAAIDLAARMNQVLENNPYSKHAELLRLRAHVALFVGDLYLPSRLTWRFEQQKQDVVGMKEKRTPQGAHRMLRTCATASEERVALSKRREEMEKALAYFRRVRAAGGFMEKWVVRFVEQDEEGF